MPHNGWQLVEGAGVIALMVTLLLSEPRAYLGIAKPLAIIDNIV
jgi:hypothetical protein